MRLDRFRRPAAATAAVIAVLALGACGTSFSAQTNQQYQAGIGADLRDSPVQLLGALIVVDDGGSGTISLTALNLSGTDQRLTDARLVSSDGTEVELTSTTSDDLVIDDGQSRTLGSEANATLPSKIYTASDVKAGFYYTLTLTFDGVGEVEIYLPAVLRTGHYGDVHQAPASDSSAETDDNE